MLFLNERAGFGPRDEEHVWLMCMKRQNVTMEYALASKEHRCAYVIVLCMYRFCFEFGIRLCVCFLHLPFFRKIVLLIPT